MDYIQFNNIAMDYIYTVKNSVPRTPSKMVSEVCLNMDTKISVSSTL